MSAEEVANAFVQHFYQTFDANASNLGPLYNNSSTMHFEGNKLVGTQAIVDKLIAVGPVQHQVKSIDVQPSTSETAILIFVTGQIKIGGDNALHFCENFQLVSTGPGQYYVHNDIFRLNYGQ